MLVQFEEFPKKEYSSYKNKYRSTTDGWVVGTSLSPGGLSWSSSLFIYFENFNILPPYKVPPNIPENYPFKLQTKQFHVIIHTFFQSDAFLSLPRENPDSSRELEEISPSRNVLAIPLNFNLQPPHFYRLIPKDLHSPDAKTISICHTSPHLPHHIHLPTSASPYLPHHIHLPTSASHIYLITTTSNICHTLNTPKTIQTLTSFLFTLHNPSPHHTPNPLQTRQIFYLHSNDSLTKF